MLHLQAKVTKYMLNFFYKFHLAVFSVNLKRSRPDGVAPRPLAGAGTRAFRRGLRRARASHCADSHAL